MKTILILSAGLLASPLFAQTIIPSCSGHRVTIPVVQHHAYTQTYHNAHNNYVQKIVTTDIHATPIFVAVPVDSVAVPVQAFRPNYFYSVGEGYAQKAMIREVISEELRKLVPPGGASVPLPNPGGTGSKPAPITNPKGPGKVVADDSTPPELQAKVLAVFNSDKGRCVSCHGPTKQSAGLQLVTEDGKLAKFNRMMRLGINNSITSGFMPPEAQTDATKAVDSKYFGDLLQWAIQKD